MQTPISITGIASLSPFGATAPEMWQHCQSGRPLFKKRDFSGSSVWIAPLGETAEKELTAFLDSHTNYSKLDRTVQLALVASRKAMDQATVVAGARTGINIGSSRGATRTFEKYHRDFLEGAPLSPFTSPSTTLGNISSWVGQELGTGGLQMEHSVTCSTSLHALLNGLAWLQADMADAFIVGGSEAALTPFTVAQMRALKLYTQSENMFCCESMRFQKKHNAMVLGEAASIAVLERGISSRTKAVVRGYGMGTETLAHGTSISEMGECFQKSMAAALISANFETVDALIMHAPGTVQGDISEKKAIDAVFGKKLPLLTSNKWLVGHTFAASGMLSVEMAVLMLKHNKFIENPFYGNSRHLPEKLKSIMINAVGFGGNAVSVVLSDK
ncbi:MAG: beta-ketoacyl synthase [Flavobacteriaceae bacterium]|mgnify:CR=1 FL=1|nr:beta-ketoacyl synthase [Flavobacteriaceae bacterium]